jgi:hypothetical protein
MIKSLLITIALLATLPITASAAGTTTATTSASSIQNKESVKEVFGIHLFFDEKEFVDVMTLETSADGKITGAMHVPNDFDAELTDIGIYHTYFRFRLLVPKNSARPHDLVFVYSGFFNDTDRKQMHGKVEVIPQLPDGTDGQPQQIAVFVGFKR